MALSNAEKQRRYREKRNGNFYLFKQKLLEKYAFQAGTWSFFEASHGKGAPDGVGGALKRTANSLVAHGRDIPDAKAFFDIIKDSDSGIELFYIESSEIDSLKSEMKTLNIKPIEGTQKIHQIAAVEDKEICYREVACFCEKNQLLQGQLCDCIFPYRKHMFHETAASTSSDHTNTKNTRQPVYNLIYSSDEDDEIDGVNEIDNGSNAEMVRRENIKVGVYVLVKFAVDSKKGGSTTFRYVGVCESEIDDDDDVKIRFLRKTKKDERVFTIDDNDISYIKFNDIVSVLPDPTLLKKGLRVYQKFPNYIDVQQR